MKAHRLRLTYSRGEAAKGMSHVETMRALEGAMKAAGLPLAYSEGKRPTPQISVAVPLAVDVTSACELADIYLSERVPTQGFVAAVSGALPAGIEALSAEAVGVGAPALQAQVRWVEYEVDVAAGRQSGDELRLAIGRLLAARSLPWEHQRETKVQRYDLRALVVGVWLEGEGEGVHRLGMRLRVTPERSGRADQVTAALGLEAPLRVHRRRIYVERTPPVLQAYRRRGEG